MWWYQSIKRERRRVKAVCGNTPLAVRDVTPLVRLEVLGLLNKILVLLKTLRLSCLNVEIAVFQTCLACSSQTHPQKENPFKLRTGQLETLLLHWKYLLQCDFVQTSWTLPIIAPDTSSRLMNTFISTDWGRQDKMISHLALQLLTYLLFTLPLTWAQGRGSLIAIYTCLRKPLKHEKLCLKQSDPQAKVLYFNELYTYWNQKTRKYTRVQFSE